jgi:hypothetical protein
LPIKTAFRPAHLFKTAQPREIAIIPGPELAVEAPVETGPAAKSFVSPTGKHLGKLFSHLHLEEHWRWRNQTRRQLRCGQFR